MEWSPHVSLLSFPSNKRCKALWIISLMTFIYSYLNSALRTVRRACSHQHSEEQDLTSFAPLKLNQGFQHYMQICQIASPLKNATSRWLLPTVPVPHLLCAAGRGLCLGLRMDAAISLVEWCMRHVYVSWELERRFASSEDYMLPHCVKPLWLWSVFI